MAFHSADFSFSVLFSRMLSLAPYIKLCVPSVFRWYFPFCSNHIRIATLYPDSKSHQSFCPHSRLSGRRITTSILVSKLRKYHLSEWETIPPPSPLPQVSKRKQLIVFFDKWKWLNFQEVEVPSMQNLTIKKWEVSTDTFLLKFNFFNQISKYRIGASPEFIDTS